MAESDVADALEYVSLSMPIIDKEAMIDYVYEDMYVYVSGLKQHQVGKEKERVNKGHEHCLPAGSRRYFRVQYQSMSS